MAGKLGLGLRRWLQDRADDHSACLQLFPQASFGPLGSITKKEDSHEAKTSCLSKQMHI